MTTEESKIILKGLILLKEHYIHQIKKAQVEIFKAEFRDKVDKVQKVIDKLSP